MEQGNLFNSFLFQHHTLYGGKYPLTQKEIKTKGEISSSVFFNFDEKFSQGQGNLSKLPWVHQAVTSQ